MLKRAVVAGVRFACCLVILATLGCDDSSPTAPEPSTPPRFTITVQSHPALSAHDESLRAAIEDATLRSSRELPLGFVQFTVSADAARSIPGWGVGGYAGPGQVEIVVDPNEPDLAAAIEHNLPPVVAHELHHVVRLGGVGFPVTLLDALVLEGLADSFATQLFGLGPFPWNQAFSEDETHAYWLLAEAELDSATFNFDAWFLRGDARLPPWTGYTLGYRLVQDYLAAHPSRSAANLVFEPTESFRPSS